MLRNEIIVLTAWCRKKETESFQEKLWLKLNQPKGRSLLFTGLEGRKNI